MLLSGKLQWYKKRKEKMTEGFLTAWRLNRFNRQVVLIVGRWMTWEPNITQMSRIMHKQLQKELSRTLCNQYDGQRSKVAAIIIMCTWHFNNLSNQLSLYGMITGEKRKGTARRWVGGGETAVTKKTRKWTGSVTARLWSQETESQRWKWGKGKCFIYPSVDDVVYIYFLCASILPSLVMQGSYEIVLFDFQRACYLLK